MSETTEYYCPWCSPGCPENEIQNISSTTPSEQRRCIICGSELRLAVPPKKSTTVFKKIVILILKITAMLILNIVATWKFYDEYINTKPILNINDNLKNIILSYVVVVFVITLLCFDIAFSFRLLNDDLKEKILNLKISIFFKKNENKVSSVIKAILMFVMSTLFVLAFYIVISYLASFLNK